MEAPAIPDRVYAIGDVHGRLDLLRALHAEVEDDLRARPIGRHVVVHIGDYTDRGPDSKGVIDYLLEGAARAAPWINLLGNHDRMFRMFLETPGGRDPRLKPQFGWLHPRLGGQETLASYGVALPYDLSVDGAEVWEAARNAVPAAHRAFLSNLTLTWRWGDWFFAHAGVRPGVPLDGQTENDLIWIREEFHQSSLDHGATVIHGHTPVEAVEDHGNRIAIDTGAAYGGALSCIVLEGASARVLGGDVLRESGAGAG